MMSIDAGVKYKGMSLEGEYYWRWLSNFTGVNTSGIANINDTGYQLQASAMAVPKALQLYSAPHRCSAATATSGKCEPDKTGIR